MTSKVPKHVAIVLDGNRRYAKKLGLSAWKGHDYGLKKIEELLNWCLELNVNELTLYCFSTENFKRSKKEIDYLFNLFWKEFENIKYRKGIFKDKVRVRVIGRTDMFSKRMKNAMLEAIRKTRKNKSLVVNFALAYGGRQEITDAVKNIAEKVKRSEIKIEDIDENTITNNLYSKDEPDLLIRPGGEIRLSNFLLWQSAYSELFFINKLWPEFTKNDLVKCFKEFKIRERRFGR